MLFSVSFFVTGEPAPQPRPRAASVPIWKDGKRVFTARMYDPGTAEDWKSRIWACAIPHRPPMPIPLPIPLDLDITFYIPRPQSHFRTGKHAGELKQSAPVRHVSADRNDLDNLEKAVMDTLEKIGFFQNDSQVTDKATRKRWCAPGQPAGCQIVLVQLEEEQQAPEGQREMFSPAQEKGLLA